MRRIAALPLVFALASTSLSAQADLTRSGGTLAQTVTFDMHGGPFQLWGLALSFNTGPTPLVIFDASDMRVLDVGFDLISLWQLGVLGPTGDMSLPIPLPSQTSLHGLPFYAQMVTIPGAGTLVDEISNRAGFVFSFAQSSVTSIAVMPEDLDLHSSTTLNDGRVLLAGGTEDSGPSFAAVDDYYVFDPQAGGLDFVATAQMTETRTQHTATLLPDGRVLTLGGADENFVPRATGEIFDPATMTATPTANMSSPRAMQTATLLNDGRVFVTGGASAFDFSDPVGSIGNILGTTELYDPATDTWTPGPNMALPRALHQASLLGDGKVLITGGMEVSSLFGLLVPFISDAAARYDPTTNTFQSTASFTGGRGLHAQITLPNGNALISGGVDGDFVTQTFNVITTCSIYNHTSNTWTSVGNLTTARGFHAMVESNGDVHVFGGIDSFDLITFTGVAIGSIEKTTTSVLSWNAVSQHVLPRGFPRASLIDNGERMLVSGAGDNASGGSIPDFTAEIYTP